MNSTEELLSKILLPINSSWQISAVHVDETSDEVYVDLQYALSYIGSTPFCVEIVIFAP